MEVIAGADCTTTSSEIVNGNTCQQRPSMGGDDHGVDGLGAETSIQYEQTDMTLQKSRDDMSERPNLSYSDDTGVHDIETSQHSPTSTNTEATSDCSPSGRLPDCPVPSPSSKGVEMPSSSTKDFEMFGKSGYEVQNTSSIRKSMRCRKRSVPSEVHSTCPNCGLSLKISDLENHLQVEINKLEKLTRHRRNFDSVKKKVTATSSSDPREIMDCHARYKQYLSVRTRRERRNKAKKQMKRPGDEETTCPVCNDTIVGTPEELAEHVDLCLQQQEANSEGELDVEGEDSFQEYTWAGQTHVRASSLLEGGLGTSGFAVAKRNCEDEDMELDIDGDDSNKFGKAQYTEADLIPCNDSEADEEQERKALRKAVLRAEGFKPPAKLPPDRQRWQKHNDTPVKCPDNSAESNCDSDREMTSSQNEVIESLKAKLKDQEVQLQKIERPKCLICMDWYTKPLTSIQCWHVHCEECWLRTLGTKKLCPQCNTITSPADLRRVFL